MCQYHCPQFFLKQSFSKEKDCFFVGYLKFFWPFLFWSSFNSIQPKWKVEDSDLVHFLRIPKWKYLLSLFYSLLFLICRFYFFLNKSIYLKISKSSNLDDKVEMIWLHYDTKIDIFTLLHISTAFFARLKAFPKKCFLQFTSQTVFYLLIYLYNIIDDNDSIYTTCCLLI